ncbi:MULTISPECIES: hypothetical protein [Reichenbachiella]|uniref:hypothetical protein n=1 Tax=Reichenbachiella TaxID=156993 RepID=UPI000E6C1A5A|nr:MULTISPECIES: hypothetical protein [Reichenbachiella]MBU2916127.1 hypothetical protein [Reichenbachiella agariperforans]RJE74986.1 hypothetical protein BGP76_17870 [Reichenbachiella sp. MSK19-1]
MKKLIFLFIVLWVGGSASLLAQNDQVVLSETITWLERKINITYFNAQTNEWWSNRFFYNSETGVINIKNTSSDVPSFLNRKSYYDRKVLLSDLDASSIKVHDVNEDQGRIVYGQVVQVNVIGNQKKIQRIKNDRPSFNEFFLQIPVPHTYDSLHVTADSIKVKLALAIELSSKIKPTDDEEQNAHTVLSMLHGEFKGTDETVIRFTRIQDNAFEIEQKNGDQYVKEGLIGFDEVNNNFYQWTINKGQRERLTLAIKSTEKVYLESSDGGYTISIHGTNHFSITEDGVHADFYRQED